jgi:hypothetical protein
MSGMVASNQDITMVDSETLSLPTISSIQMPSSPIFTPSVVSFGKIEEDTLLA